MDLRALVTQLRDEGAFTDVMTNTTVQFGEGARTYLGATLLPERTVPRNEYTEKDIRFNTVIAVDGDRYSPAQIRQAGGLSRWMKVTLADSDIARQIDAEDLDTLIEMLGNNMDEQAAMRILGGLDTLINTALIELNEVQRWQAMINCVVQRRGDNGYAENVYYPNPPQHRSTVLAQWSDPATDPWPDIVGKAQFLQNKGFIVNRIITSQRVVSILLANPKIADRVGAAPIIVGASGQLSAVRNFRLDRASLDNLFQRDRLPVIETYDLSYRTQVGRTRFMPDDVMVFVCTTGRSQEIIDRDELLLVPETLGYTAIGRAAGQSAPGRASYVQYFDNKAPRIEMEGWQTSLPVIQEPEAIGTLTGIS